MNLKPASAYPAPRHGRHILTHDCLLVTQLITVLVSRLLYRAATLRLPYREKFDGPRLLDVRDVRICFRPSCLQLEPCFAPRRRLIGSANDGYSIARSRREHSPRNNLCAPNSFHDIHTLRALASEQLEVLASVDRMSRHTTSHEIGNLGIRAYAGEAGGDRNDADEVGPSPGCAHTC